MASTKTGKYGAYQEIFNKVDPGRQAVAEKYIAELKFMESQLKKLKQTIRKEGAVDEFQQGKQSMMRESPAMKAYCSLVQRYGDMGKKLADLLPDKKDMARSAAGEKLASFLEKGKCPHGRELRPPVCACHPGGDGDGVPAGAAGV